MSKSLTSAPLLVAFLQTTIQGRNCPDFQAELFLVHSPLLKESYLVSFPPLTYMLKFGGFAGFTSCLNWATHLSCGWFCETLMCTLKNSHNQHRAIQSVSSAENTYWRTLLSLNENDTMQTLKKTCPQEYPGAQYAFKILLIHGILQFTMLIALRCALHRCSSQDIHRWKL